MDDLNTYTGIKKAIILAGGQNTKLNPLVNYYPVWMLPVLSRPIIEYNIDILRKIGIEDITISLSEHYEIPDIFKEKKFSDIKINFHVEDKPRGTAGALKDLEEFIGEHVFIVINSGIFIEKIDINKALELFYKSKSAALVGVTKEIEDNNVREGIKIASDSNIKSFHIIHSSMDKRSPWKSSGIYIFDPAILKFITYSGYMDIKEQLIPALKRESLNVSAYEIEGSYQCIDTVNDYIRIHRDILQNGNTNLYLGDKLEVSERVWAGKDVEISPKAYLLGPIVIGDNCKIEDSAQIIGPAVIGNRCQISQGVLFRESILYDDVSLSNGVKIEYSLIFNGTDLPTDLYIKNIIAINGMRIGDANLIHSDYSIKGIASLSGIASLAGSKYRIYKIVKRLMDITLSAAGLVLLLPLLLLIALAIKLDSPGPSCYVQKRCGLRGKLFGMIKFRTMRTDAEKLHKELLSEKDTDGPMFKMFNDPRVTKVGKFLRKTSLDEILQLFNILKGDMSLVGPRPLIMEEMKFSPSWRDIRLKVKPGITGLWQVLGRRENSFHDWIQYDVYYVRKQSLWLDIKILFKTVKVVINKVGSY